HLLILRRAVVLPRQIRHDGLARVALEARAQRERRQLSRFRIREHFRAVHTIERQRRAVDVGGAESRAAVFGVDAPLGEAKGHTRREVVYDDDARRVALDAGLGEAVQLAPYPPAVKRRHLREWRRREQFLPLTR